MTPRTDVQQATDGPREVRSSARPPSSSKQASPTGQASSTTQGRPPLPNLTGDLDSMLGSEPAFRTQVRGYDRLQVDNYVTWAEAELQSARRHVEDLTSRYGSCLAELEISRRLLAQSPTGRELTRISERIGQMLRLAADEAADLTTAASREADRVLGESRTEADAILRKAHDVKEAAVAASDRMRQEARTLRAEAMGVLDRARREAAELLQAAAMERRHLDEQTEEARDCLRRVTSQIGEAIDAITGDIRRDFGRPGQPLPMPHRFHGNRAARLPDVPLPEAALPEAVLPEPAGS